MTHSCYVISFRAMYLDSGYRIITKTASAECRTRVVTALSLCRELSTGASMGTVSITDVAQQRQTSQDRWSSSSVGTSSGLLGTRESV